MNLGKTAFTDNLIFRLLVILSILFLVSSEPLLAKKQLSPDQLAIRLEDNDQQVRNQAIEGLRYHAKRNNINAQILLGHWLSKQTSAHQVYEGLNWLEKAAKSNHPLAFRHLGSFYLGHNKINRRDYYLANDYLRQAIAQGDQVSKKLLASLYESGALVTNAEESAFNLNLQVAATGDPQAMYRVAQAYEVGIGTETNLQEAFTWYKHAAEAKYVDAMMHLGRFYQQGIGHPVSIQSAKYWHKKAAEHGRAHSQYQLALLSENEDNNEFSVKWYQRAADQGYIPAMNRLGDLYYRGIGVNRDIPRAKINYSMSANLQNEYGQYQYANILYRDETVSAHHQKSKRLLIKSAEQGFVQAQSLLGRLYYSPGQQQDFNQAKYWLEQAAAQDDMFALTTLGEMYRYGRGVHANKRIAFDYFQRAANKGNIEAMMLVGLSFQQGLGVGQNHLIASKWYKRAAGLGNPQAQYNLATLYMKGQGIRKDLVRAYAWVNLAARNGHEAAKKARHNLKYRLNEENLAKAQELSYRLLQMNN